MHPESRQDASIAHSAQPSEAGGSPDLPVSETGRFSSTLVVSSGAPQSAVDDAVREMEERNAVHEHCGKCGALLDVSDCVPLGETECPLCHSGVIVLKEFHHFVLLNSIGRGGMGMVYRAFDRTLQRDVALKLLRNEFTSRKEYVEQLEREAQITASISHPNVVRVYSAGKENGFYYLAMEIVTGGTLTARIKQGGRLSEAAVLEIGIQIASGLNAAHLRGLLHRDVKPGNMLFNETGAVKVADFGLALPVEQAAKLSGDIWGTPYYIAPEKLQSHGEDVGSDIYSLGATLFHALAGRPPFEAKTAQEVAIKHVQSRPVSVQTFAPEVSGATAAILAQMLEKDPAQRQQSYAEVLKQLQYAREALASGQATRHRKVQEEILRDRSQQDQVWMWFTVACLVLLAGVGALFLIPKKRDPEPAPARPAPPVSKTDSHPAPAAPPPPATPAVRIAESAAPAATAKPVDTPRLETGIYRIVNREDRRALEDGAGADGWVRIALAPADPQELRQQWLVHPLSEGLYRLESCATGRVLEVTSGKKDDGTPVSAHPWNGWSFQKWFIERTASGGYRFLAKHSGKSFGTEPNAKSKRSNPVQQPANETAEQLWDFVPVRPAPETLAKGMYAILNAQTGRALHVDGAKPNNGTQARLGEYVAQAHQQWTVTPTGDGYYKAEAVHSGKALELRGNPPNLNPLGVEVWDFKTDVDFHWKFEPLGGDRYKVVCKAFPEKALTSEGDGTHVVLADSTGAIEQCWIVAPVPQK